MKPELATPDNVMVACSQARRKRGGRGVRAPPLFGRSVNPISTRGGKSSPPNSTCHSRFSDLATGLAVLHSTYVLVRVSKGGKKNYYYEWGEKHLSLGTHKLGACKTMSNNNSKKILCLPKRITCLSLLSRTISLCLNLDLINAKLLQLLIFLVW